MNSMELDSKLAIIIEFNQEVFPNWPAIVCKAERKDYILTVKEIGVVLYLEALYMIYASKCEVGEAKMRNIVNSTLTVSNKSITKKGITYTYDNNKLTCDRYGKETSYDMKPWNVEYEMWYSDKSVLYLKHGRIAEGPKIDENKYKSGYIHLLPDKKSFHMAMMDGMCDGMQIV